MIKVSTEFKTDDKILGALYNKAKEVLLGSVKSFGDYRIITEGVESDRITLMTGILCAESLVRFDPETAMNSVKAFFLSAREDGRIPSSIIKRDGEIYGDFSGLSHFSFAEEALSIFYMEKKKEIEYLDMIYGLLKKFDKYLFKTRDLNKNGLPELDNSEENTEGRKAIRYSNTARGGEGYSPYPLETALMAAFSYKLKRVLTEISMIKGDGEALKYRGEALLLLEQIKNKFYRFDRSACFDIDSRGVLVDALTIDNLIMMYYGAFDGEMAGKFVSEHLLNPDEFNTPLPLPTVAANDRSFSVEESYKFDGQVRGVNYRRAIRALKNYGYTRELLKLSRNFLDTVARDMAFSEQYDPFSKAATGKIKDGYAPTASAVIEFICNMYGVSVDRDKIEWGAVGHLKENSSEFLCTRGGNTYKLSSEKETASAYMNGNHLFTVSSGTIVETDAFGLYPKVTNVTDEDIDVVFVYKNHTYSMNMKPGEAVQL